MNPDPKDRQNIDPVSVPGMPEGTPMAGPMPSQSLGQVRPPVVEDQVGLSPDQLRPSISSELTAINVQHGPDTLRLSDSAQGVVQTNNPPLRSLPGGVALKPEKFGKMASHGSWRTGERWKGVVGTRQIDREKELNEAA